MTTRLKPGTRVVVTAYLDRPEGVVKRWDSRVYGPRNALADYVQVRLSGFSRDRVIHRNHLTEVRP